jgi:hypothetical protein
MSVKILQEFNINGFMIYEKKINFYDFQSSKNKIINTFVNDIKIERQKVKDIGKIFNEIIEIRKINQLILSKT